MTRARNTAAHAAKALGALAATGALLAGLPYALTRFVGWPLPRTVPTWSSVQHALTGPVIGPTLYIDALACLLWLCWAVLAASFLIELCAHLARVPAPRVPGLGPAQFLAAALIGAIALSIAARPADAATPRLPDHLLDTASTAAAPQHPATTPAAATAHPRETMHTVQRGENLFEIAQHDLGDGDQWPTLYRLNEGAPQPDGRTLTNPDLIQPGWHLRTTADTSAIASTPPSTPTTPAPPTASHTPPPAASPHNPGIAHAQTGPSGAHSTAHPEVSGSPRAVHSPATARPAAARSGSLPGWVALAGGGALSAAVLAALSLAARRARRHQRWSDTCYWPRPGERPPAAPLTLPALLHPAPPSRHPEREDPELDAHGAPSDHEPDPSHVLAATLTGDVHNHATDSRPHGHNANLGDPAKPRDPEPLPVADLGEQSLTLQQAGPLLALTGPGALGAARALAATALTTATPDTATAHLIIPRRDAALLLDSTDQDLDTLVDGVGELELVDDTAAGLTILEQYIAHRTRLLHEHDCPQLDQLPDDGDPQPPVLLIAIARPDLAPRTTATLTAGTDLRVHAILLGDHPDTPTWHIDTDAHLHGTDLPPHARAFDLPAPGLRATIRLLAQSTGHTQPDQPPPTPPDPTGPLAVPTDQPDTDRSPEQPETSPQHANAPHHANDDTSPAYAQSPATQQSETATSPAVTRPTPVSTASGGEADRVAAITETFENTPVRITVLGVHTIHTPGGPVDGKMRHDSWRLAARLAVHHRRGQHTEDLAALWPDHGDEAMRTALKHALYTLRKALRDKSTDATGHGRFAPHITNVNNRYAFNPHLVGVDLAAFSQLRALAAQTRDITERTAAAEAALALYDGELLAGLDEEWMLAPRAMARRDALATATLLAQLADRADDPETALGWWERALSIDDNEEVYRQIITTQARLGRRADAIATRDLLIARLDTDGASPSPETRALLAHALTRRPGPAAAIAQSEIRRTNPVDHERAVSKSRAS